MLRELLPWCKDAGLRATFDILHLSKKVVHKIPIEVQPMKEITATNWSTIKQSNSCCRGGNLVSAADSQGCSLDLSRMATATFDTWAFSDRTTFSSENRGEIVQFGMLAMLTTLVEFELRLEADVGFGRMVMSLRTLLLELRHNVSLESSFLFF